MALRKTAPLLAIVALTFVGGVFLAKRFNEIDSPPKERISREFPTAADATPEVTGGGERLFADYQNADKTQSDDLALIADVLSRYFVLAKSEASRFPMGINREVTRVLAGHNPMRVEFLPSTHPAIDTDGELTDRWGTPLHFHGLRADLFEIVSAGPDSTLFTDDDIRHLPSLAQR